MPPPEHAHAAAPMSHGARSTGAGAAHSLMARTQRQLQTLTRRHPRRCAGVLLLSLVLLGALLSLSSSSSSSSSPGAPPRAPLTVTSLAARAGSMLARLPAVLLRAVEDPDVQREEQRAAAAAAARELILESEERDAGMPAMRNLTTTDDDDAADSLAPRPRGELEAGYRLLPVYPALRPTPAPAPASTLVEEEGGADAKDKDKEDSKSDTAKPDKSPVDQTRDSKSGDAAPKPAPKATPAAAPGAHWTYTSPRTGPFMWGNLDPKYVACNAGHRQSPVDFKVVDPVRHPSLASLPSAVRTDPSLQHILFNYAPAIVTLMHHDNVTHIDTLLNNGHTLQVAYESGSGVYVRGRRYDLAQFHFHSPSEHTLNGRAFDMEMHLVHAAPDGSGRLVVVALWLEVPRGVVAAIHDLRGQYSSLDDLHDGNTFGEVKRLLHVGASPFLDSLGWSKLPESPGAGAHAAAPVLNVFDALPFDQGYLTYEGSLTTPPCSEVVSWYVLKAPVALSLAQKNAFVALFGQNARPTQLLHGRNVTQTVDQERVSVIASGVSHDVFMGVLGSLIVVSLLLVFAIIFICTRSAHRLARAADSKTRLYSMMTPDAAASRYPYHAINPLDDELESGNKHRATAHSNAQAMSGAAQLALGADSSSSNSSSRSGSGGSTRGGSGSGSGRPLRTNGNAFNSGGAANYGSVL